MLQTDQKGVLIRRIEPTAPVSKSLKKGDILLSFDGVNIANDGTVPFRSGERISFNYLVSRKYTNEEVTSRLSVRQLHACVLYEVYHNVDHLVTWGCTLCFLSDSSCNAGV